MGKYKNIYFILNIYIILSLSKKRQPQLVLTALIYNLNLKKQNNRNRKLSTVNEI